MYTKSAILIYNIKLELIINYGTCMIELGLKAVISIIAALYYILRFKKYIENRKNNNITGDVLFRWESVSLVDKYHLRERIFGGSRLRIKKDAKRREIKYYVVSFIPAAIFVVFSLITEDVLLSVSLSVNIMLIVKLLFDAIEGKSKKSRLFIDELLIMLSAFGYVLSIIKPSSISDIKEKATAFDIGFDKFEFGIGFTISCVVIVAVLIFSIIKRRKRSVFICVLVIIATVIASGFSEGEGTLLMCFAGFTFVSFVVMQSIYNVRALKRITFIN